MLIWHLFYFDLIFVVLDIWAFSLCCWVFEWSRLWWDVTTCLSVDFYKGFFKVITNIGVSETSRWTDDCWCLLDALRWSLCSARFWFNFMFFRLYMMGSRCRQTLTREGGVAIWICSDHSSTGSMLSFEDIDKWMHFFNYLAAVGQICVVSGQCASDYMQWLFMISHPFMTPA